MSKKEKTADKVKVNVKYFATFRDKTNKKQETIKAKNIKELINEIKTRNSKMKGELLKKDNKINESVIIMINGRNIKHLDGIKTKLNKEDRISIFPPVAGG